MKIYQKRLSKGFALIATISVLSLLVMIAIGMLSLSSVTTRAADHEIPQAQAKANARMALMLALGDLQKMAGPDTRVTASAEAVAGVNGSPYVTGVWRSWEGNDHDSSGLPTAPDYDSKLQKGDLDIDATNGGRFLGWLVSTPEKDNDADSPPSIDSSSSTVPLLAEGTLGDNSDGKVYLEPTEIGDTGSYAWWIQGENQKALMKKKPEDPDADDTTGWSQRLASNGRPNTEELGFSDDEELSKVSSRQSMDLVTNSDYPESADVKVSGAHFHDITAYSRGLLTNTANGGWKRDLSLMTEKWDDLAASNLRFFTLEPGVETTAQKNAGTAGGLIYPWAVESDHGVMGGAANGWGALVDYATMYQNISAGDSSGVATFAQSEGDRDNVNLTPVLARIHWVLSLESQPEGELYRAYVNVNPVVTYWNPYNVALSGATSSFWLMTKTAIPYNMTFSVGDNSIGPKLLKELTGTKNFTLSFPADSEVWEPGEARVYSMNIKEGTNRYSMQRGYEGAADNSSRKLNLTGSATDSFTVELSSINGASTYKFETYEWTGKDVMKAAYDIDYEGAEEYWGEPTIANTTQKMGALALSGPSPFLIQMFQLHNTNQHLINAKGYLNRKPILKGVYNGSSGLTTVDSFPYDFVIKYPNGSSGVSSGEGIPVAGIPESDPYGFIGNSYDISDGLKSIVAAEIPTKPLSSMGELQSFDINAYNPVPPYTANPIGNSHACYLIAPNQVVMSNDYDSSEQVSYDHSYVSNHLLFDDWFVSSIAPETDGYSAYPASVERNLENVLESFLSDEISLANKAYKAAPGLTASDADDLLADPEIWHYIASKIEVEGMFNVNSTSLKAWTSLLKHQGDSSVPYVSGSAVSIEGGGDYPVSRTTIAGDPNAGTSEYSVVGTHKRLTDSQIEALATQIVDQVKKRGPFLSFSEFMNRQLINDSGSESLAMSGAVESALTVLSTSAESENPFKVITDVITESKGLEGDDSHLFPLAAVGNSAYGFPGWIRQADVLRPLLPVLSVRDDTFTIRAYGDSKDASGKILAKAWCEAVVQRQADYVDIADESKVLPSDATLTSEANKFFGRKFAIISFRWLSPDEV
ncbi:hypothetical protein [Rubritalea sp.]|uniref:hypothetical protein n=1 Tax=Rubritalea sp. TaxID=2109375 RepID=UPI003EF87ADC